MIKLLYKEKNVSSFQKIKTFAKENNIKKIGHSGTLDPMATGLLLIATDEDTKLLNYIDKEFKSYITTMKFGFKSDTLDAEGKIEKIVNFQKVTLSDVKSALNAFTGKYWQTPPKFSAKKINGTRAYQLARSEKNFSLNKVEVEIKSIIFLDFNFEKQELKFEVEVSRGTYIRSLVQDIAHYLNGEAIMTELERHKINNLSIADLNKNEINPLILIKNIKTTSINLNELILLLKGIKLNTELDNLDNTILIFNQKIVGFAKIENKKLISTKLFGNKIEKILKE
ncbi:tRNA pseudouridine(55) synthase TruB [Mesomycoplasma lagogenitalium]|uniref:tRNA pseudouridine synthase B n=1 Tax=Mesomycoplasma lagogenitalium TaxID=171286 RepID=A0ABY8LSZ7_9BACT|nr:tRNA pseudouridine(55) synthase TruB [Mesomycoplasma lagogenitalium]WGI36369.1 tRNA pseudouridine(55) synthase TruB [Mesomycoplasma lagogenitalium]